MKLIPLFQIRNLGDSLRLSSIEILILLERPKGSNWLMKSVIMPSNLGLVNINIVPTTKEIKKQINNLFFLKKIINEINIDKIAFLEYVSNVEINKKIQSIEKENFLKVFF